MNILIAADYYLPGSKAGGPIRSLANLVASLGDEFVFRIVTRDRDCGDDCAYPGVTADCWQRVGKAHVYYLSPRNTSLAHWRALLRSTPHDVLYLNSFFSPCFTVRPLLLRRFGLIPRRSVVLSPKGELAPSALAMKSRKKRLFAPFARTLDLYRNIIWQASSSFEAADIARHWIDSSTPGLVIAPDMCEAVPQPLPPPPKTSGALTIAFLSRISPVKNLDGALSILASLSGQIAFNIYGPVENPSYWVHCQNLIAALPPNVQVNYGGAIPPSQIASILSRHHLFFLPTRGENFGHAILEALAAGCPVLIGDQTPWRGLAERQAGWDLPLDRPGLFRQVLQQCVEMDEPAHRRFSQGARAFYQRILDEGRSVHLHREMFLRAASVGVRRRGMAAETRP